VSDVKRSSQLPDIPTAHEAGVPGYQSTGWGGLVVPKGTPAAIVAKLNAAVQKALNSPDIRDKIVHAGSEPSPSSPEEFRRFIREEYDRIGNVVRVAKLTLD
jgi:tripartite-type tricarboxylate transporter receptor subunit TctC